MERGAIDLARGRQDGGSSYWIFHCDCTVCKRWWYIWFLVQHHFYWEEEVPREVTSHVMRLATLLHDMREPLYTKELKDIGETRKSLSAATIQLQKQDDALKYLLLEMARIERDFSAAKLVDPTAATIQMPGDALQLGEVIRVKSYRLREREANMSGRKQELEAYLNPQIKVYRFYIQHQRTGFSMYNMRRLDIATEPATVFMLTMCLLIMSDTKLASLSPYGHSLPAAMSTEPRLMTSCMTWINVMTQPPVSALNLHKALGCEEELTFSIESGGVFWFALVLPSTSREWTLRFYRCAKKTADVPQYPCDGGEWCIKMHNTLTLATVEPCIKTTLLGHLIENGYGCGALARYCTLCWHCYSMQTSVSGNVTLDPLDMACRYCAAALCSQHCKKLHIERYHYIENWQSQHRGSDSSSSSSSSSFDTHQYNNDSDDSDDYYFSDDYISRLD